MNQNWLKNLKRKNGKTNLLAVVLLSYFTSFDDDFITIKRKNIADLLGYKKRMISRGMKFLEDRELINRKIIRYPYLALYINDEVVEIEQIKEEKSIKDIINYYKEKYPGKKIKTKITYRSKLTISINQEKIDKISDISKS